MSYDLDVYVPGTVDAAAIRDLVTTTPALDFGDVDDARGWYTVVRGARGRYCFTIEGPAPVEPEDVPADVTQLLLGATHVVRVSVEGSAAADVPHATRFARRLAQARAGVVVDQQLGEVWAKGAARPAAKPPRGERVSVIELNWYCHRDSVAADFGARYVALCRNCFPKRCPGGSARTNRSRRSWPTPATTVSRQHGAPRRRRCSSRHRRHASAGRCPPATTSHEPARSGS